MKTDMAIENPTPFFNKHILFNRTLFKIVKLNYIYTFCLIIKNIFKRV